MIEGMESFSREVALSTAEAAAAVEETAQAWAADWDAQSGALLLPLAAGMRSGMARCRLELVASAAGTRLTLKVLERVYRVRWNAVMVLLFSAIGALLTVLWPLFPKLLPVAPFGAVLALVGWFLVISRLVTNSPEQFLEAVAQGPAAP